MRRRRLSVGWAGCGRQLQGRTTRRRDAPEPLDQALARDFVEERAPEMQFVSQGTPQQLSSSAYMAGRSEIAPSFGPKHTASLPASRVISSRPRISNSRGWARSTSASRPSRPLARSPTRHFRDGRRTFTSLRRVPTRQRPRLDLGPLSTPLARPRRRRHSPDASSVCSRVTR